MTTTLTRSFFAIALLLGLHTSLPTASAQRAGASQDRADGSARAQRRSRRGRHDRTPPTAAERAQRQSERLTRLTERLSLTPAQQSQVRTLIQDTGNRMQALRATTAGAEGQPRASRRAARRAIRFEQQDRLHAILSCEQREQMRLMRREMRVTRRGQGRARHGRRGQGRMHGERRGTGQGRAGRSHRRGERARHGRRGARMGRQGPTQGSN